MKVGVYIGSFNPIHKGHKQVVDHLLKNNYVDKIIIIPTGNYWDKNNLIDIEDRINMAKFYESNNIVVNNKLYEYEHTYQILNSLKSEGDRLYLVIGSDNLPKFHLWENVDEILEYEVLVMPRGDLDISKYIEKFKNKNKFILVDKFKSIDTSSTLIRKLIEVHDINKLKKLLDEDILNYILKNNLYKKQKMEK